MNQKILLTVIICLTASLALIPAASPVHALSQQKIDAINDNYLKGYLNGTFKDMDEVVQKQSNAIKEEESRESVVNYNHLKAIVEPNQDMTASMLFKNITSDKDTPGFYHLNGELIGNTNQTDHYVTVKAKFYDANNKLIGSSQALVVGDDVGANETVPFRITITDGEIVNAANGVEDIDHYTVSASGVEDMIAQQKQQLHLQ
jgi:hypothetical protein